MERMLDARYRVRAPRQQDAEAVHALLNVLSFDNYGEPFRMGVEEPRGQWRTRDQAANAWMVMDDEGQAVGYADVYAEEHVQVNGAGGTHPDGPPGSRHRHATGPNAGRPCA